MSKQAPIPTTDELAARANRRWMPPPARKFKDKNKYSRKAKHKGNHE